MELWLWSMWKSRNKRLRSSVLSMWKLTMRILLLILDKILEHNTEKIMVNSYHENISNNSGIYDAVGYSDDGWIESDRGEE